MQSLLLFHRNDLQHPGHPWIRHGEEMEFPLALTFEDFLPDLIGSISRLGGMFI
jgi:hypothetical protein